MKKAFISILLSLSAISAFSQAPARLTEKDYLRIAPDPSKGFTYPYYLYVPPEMKAEAARKEVQTFLVLPNNTGRPEDDFAVHEASVKRRMESSGSLGSEWKLIMLMPVFPRPKSDWTVYTQALDRDSMVSTNPAYRRLDLQMLAMIDHAREMLKGQGVKVDKRVLLNGFSAQGMFVNRFTFLHPKRVKAVVVGSPGGWPIVPAENYKDKPLRYPIGVADLKTVAGEKLDLKNLCKVPMFIFLGDKDENDSVPFDDSYDDVDREIINPLLGRTPVSRWEIAKQLYKEAGLNAEFRLYPGVDHSVTAPIRDDIRAFLLKYK